MQHYNGVFRTRLTKSERERIRKLAKERGMNLTGFHDYLLKSEIERSRAEEKASDR